MRWQDSRRSSNVEDRRARPARGRGAKVGGAGGVVVVVVALLMIAMGKDPSALLGALGSADTSSSGASAGATGGGTPLATSPEEEQQVEFVSATLGMTEDVWAQLFQAQGQRYLEPRLVLFRDQVDSACGLNSSAVGPFYCPADQQVYIDLAFFDELHRRFGAPGDFAQAYVLAHEVGHHVQRLTGVSARVHAERRRVSEAQGNELSVRQELQADCYAGVWAHHANRQRQVLAAGDVEEGLRAAAAIGDDTLQRRAGVRVAPESWTHGSSEQRVRWFRRGLDTGDMAQCDTFAASAL